MHVNDVNLIKAGVPLLLATDAGMADPDRLATMSARAQIDRPTELGEAHFRWFAAVAEKGMKPMDAILAATRNVAAAYKKLDRLGTIERGKLADLVVLDADPLADLANIRRISLAIKGGAHRGPRGVAATPVLSRTRGGARPTVLTAVVIHLPGIRWRWSDPEEPVTSICVATMCCIERRSDRPQPAMRSGLAPSASRIRNDNCSSRPILADHRSARCWRRRRRSP